MPTPVNNEPDDGGITTLQMCRGGSLAHRGRRPREPRDHGRMDEMNPKMTEFLAQDRIAGLRAEAARNQLAKRGADVAPPIVDRPHPETTTPVLRVGRWLRRSIPV